MITVSKLVRLKGERKITMLTAYDALTATILERAGVDMILVGDSLGMVVLGYNSTLPVTLDDVIRHASAVRNGAPQTFVVADMPFGSYGASIEQGVISAVRLMKESGANAVKLEGGERMADLVSRLVGLGIPVMGHIGLQPQSVNQTGFKINGKDEEQIRRLIEDAIALQDAGVFAIVLEGVTAEAAREVTVALDVPTIGIGAGKDTDGQVLVITDMLGMDSKAQFKHNKRYANLEETIGKAVGRYIQEVQEGSFPGEEQTFHKNGAV